MFRIARHGTPNGRERSTMKSRLLGRGVMALSLTIGSMMLPGAAFAASPGVIHVRSEFTHEETNTNICGDWGVFRFSGTDTFTVVDFSDGVFQFEFLGRGTYTLTFLDEPQETWNSRWVESFTFHATPGGTIVLTSAFNSFEGPIRIHETMTLVVGPDGSVRVDNATFVVDECPSA
jgi:hypothetical protein